MSQHHYGRVYLCDNGRALCHSHLGSCAAATGRDISGQPIMEITPAMVAEAERAYPGVTLACETCGTEPHRVWHARTARA